MTKLSTSLLSSARGRHWSFMVLLAASIALFWTTLRELATLSLSTDADSYIVVIPAISALFIYLERARIFVDNRESSPPSSRTPAVGGVATFGLLAVCFAAAPVEYTLSVKVACFILVCAAAFALCYGPAALKAARFPLLLLLLMVPIPVRLMDNVVAVLQRGSVDAVYMLFRMAGVPVFRMGMTLQLPVVGVEVAKECSSIHSASALFLTGVLAGHLFLRSLQSKICLTLLTAPIAVFTNAVRIATLWFLGTRVDRGFLHGNLHHHGGALFALVGLAILMICLILLRKLDRRAADSVSQGKGTAAVAWVE